jgi:hypothetical protein
VALSPDDARGVMPFPDDRMLTGCEARRCMPSCMSGYDGRDVCTGDRTMMKVSGSFLLAGVCVAFVALTACTQTGPVEFSATGADSSSMSRADDLDFGPMDHSVATCKAVAQKAGVGQCVKVRAYESCMKSRGYITVLGPENPSGCGEPAWESDVRKWLQ